MAQGQDTADIAEWAAEHAGDESEDWQMSDEELEEMGENLEAAIEDARQWRTDDDS